MTTSKDFLGSVSGFTDSAAEYFTTVAKTAAMLGPIGVGLNNVLNFRPFEPYLESLRSYAKGVDDIAINKRALTQVQSFTVPRNIGKYFLQMSVSDYRRDSLLQVARTVPIGVLNLPLPRPLMDQHQVAYEERPLGTLGGNLLNNLF